MTDEEIREKLRALDRRDDADLSSWECGFLESVIHDYAEPWRLTDKQRAVAIAIIEQYEVDSRSETITKLPPGAERWFRKP